MRVYITRLLKEFCLKNGVDIGFISSETVRVLNNLNIQIKNIEIDLGIPDNSYSYPNNTDSFSVLLNPMVIVNIKDGIQFEHSACYELGHEMCHSVISQELRFLENVTLDVSWFLNNGFPLDQAIKATIKNSLENIKIDSSLIENEIMMKGFYNRQYQEWLNTKKYLKNNPIMDNKFVWLGEFLGVCRRDIVSKRAKDLKLPKERYSTLDMYFRQQRHSFLSKFKIKELTNAWELMKQSQHTNNDYTFEINEKLISLCQKNN